MSDLNIKPVEKLDYEFECLYPLGDKWEFISQKYGTDEEKNFGDIDLERLVIFKIVGQGRFYGVNLRDGSFNLNGLTLQFDLGVKIFEDGHTERLVAEKFSLIYFRRIKTDFLSLGEQVTSIRYCIGWQTNIDGKNYQRLVFIDAEGKIIISNKK